MEAVCEICEEVLTDHPTIQLLCGHHYHTQCFLTNLAVAEDLHDMECVVCHQGLYPNVEAEAEAEAEEDQHENNDAGTYEAEQTRIGNLYETNEDFRKDIKKYVTAVRAGSKPRVAFRKLVAAKKAELAPTYAQIKAQYEGLYNIKKDELLDSDAYKAYKSADARQQRLYSHIRRKYDVTAWGLRSLATKPGCRSLRTYLCWRDSPPRVLRRGLRLFLPRY